MLIVPLLAAGLALFRLCSSEYLSTTGRWIVDSNNERYKLRCVNWGGHLEVGIPEGLQHKSIDYIASWIARNNFNCVRMTYSIDMALSPNTPVSQSFAAAAGVTGVAPSTLQALYSNIILNNPQVANLSTLGTFGAIISSLESHGVNVILDNHVSKAQWCCNLTDGNGWWADAAGYNDFNSRYFNNANWLAGLGAMARFAKSHPNVIGMSLRNELRAFLLQDFNNHADWFRFVAQGADAVHAAHPDLLIMIGGVDSANNFAFQRWEPLSTAAWAGKVVWEYHIYAFSVGYVTDNCDIFSSQMGAAAGYLLEQGKPFTGPLWLSEFGLSQLDPSAGETAYLDCLVQYMEGNDADWAVWAIQGDYYVREGQPSSDEPFGLLDSQWNDWRNPAFPAMLGGMFNVTQGP